MTKVQSKRADGARSDAERPPYELTKVEVEAVAAFTAAQTKSGPRLKVGLDGKDKVRLRIDHPDQAVGTGALVRAIGTADFDFYDVLIGQLANASKEATASERGANFMPSVGEGHSTARSSRGDARDTDGCCPHGHDDVRPPPRARREHPAAGQCRAGVTKLTRNLRRPDVRAEGLPLAR
jgi:hypothetical protein